MEAGWEAAEVVVEGEYETTWQEHAYLQPEAGLAYIDDARPGYCPGRRSMDARGSRTDLSTPWICRQEQVRVIYPAIGGAFGGREDMSVQIILALAAWKLRQPVKIQWNREESILYHHKRHPIKVRAKWGATGDGMLTAVSAEVIGDAGAYNYTSNKVLGNAQLTVSGPYEIPNVACRYLYRIYQQHPVGGIPRLWRAASAFRCRRANEPIGGRAGYGPAGNPAEELHPRRQHRLSGHAFSRRRYYATRSFEACGRESWWAAR